MILMVWIWIRDKVLLIMVMEASQLEEVSGCDDGIVVVTRILFTGWSVLQHTPVVNLC